MIRVVSQLRWIVWSLLIILTSGCSVTEEDIVEYGKDGQFDKLIRYIEKNHENPDKVKLVQIAATQLFRKDPQRYVWDKVRYHFLNEAKPDLVRRSLLAIGDKGAATFLQRAVTGVLHTATDADYRETVKLIGWTVELNLEPRDSLLAIHTTVTRILDLDSKLDSLKSERWALDNNLTAAKKKAAKDEQWMSQNDPVQVIGYIRSQQEEGVYEVTINGESAVLIATDTRFETTGRFRLFATQLAEMPVTLKPEYGGFTQKWKVYREVPKAELDTRFDLANKKRELMAKAQPKRISQMGELQRMDRLIDELAREIENLKQKADRINSFDVFYELNQE